MPGTRDSGAEGEPQQEMTQQQLQNLAVARRSGDEPASDTVFHIQFHNLPCHQGKEIRGQNRDWAGTGVLAQHANKIRAA